MDDDMTIPAFANEAEEVAWWDAHRDSVPKRFRKAHNEGGLRFVPPDNRGPKFALRPLTLRVSEADIALAQKQAESKGLPYQTYIKSLLHETLIAREAADTPRARKS